MNKENYFILKENIKSESNQVEVYFCDAGFSPLFESQLNKNELYFFGEDFSIGDIKDVNVNIKIDPNKKIRIWSSHKCIQEYLNFLYFCYKFEGKNISVVFVDEYLDNLWSIGAATYEEISEMLKYERNLLQEEINKYRELWGKLTNENSELRLFKNKKVISVNYNYLNDYILKYYNKNDISGTIAKLMVNDEENHFSDYIYKLLLDKLFFL